MLRSAVGRTVVATEDVSLPELVSISVTLVIVAVLLIVPTVVALRTTVMNTFAPGARVGIVQVIVEPEFVQVPPGTVAELNVPDEYVSVTTMLVAALKVLAFATFTEYVA